jgi:hypothetical protein
VNPGHEVELVNVSAVGACVEAAFALLPGRPLQLHATGRGRRAAIEARVAWCKVTAVMSGRGVRFTAGLAFMRWVDLAKELALAKELTLSKDPVLSKELTLSKEPALSKEPVLSKELAALQRERTVPRVSDTRVDEADAM